MRIARMREADVDAFWSVLDSVARERLFLAMLQAPPREDVLSFLCESVAKDRPQFAAFVDDTLVAWCDITEKPRDALKHSGVLGMGVLRECRGRGIGSALMKATLDDAWSKGLTRVELTVRTDNERAKRLYERFGFVVEGLCRRHMLVDGEYRDSYLMAVLHG